MFQENRKDGWKKMSKFDERDKNFAGALNEYVNNMCADYRVSAEECRRHHRYLKSEEFLFAVELLRAFAKDLDEKNFDDRNKYSTVASKLLVDYFISDEFDKKAREIIGRM